MTHCYLLFIKKKKTKVNTLKMEFIFCQFVSKLEIAAKKVFMKSVSHSNKTEKAFCSPTGSTAVFPPRLTHV